MPGDFALMQITEEIRRLESRRAEVEACIQREGKISPQLKQHLASVDRTLAFLKEQKARWFRAS